MALQTECEANIKKAKDKYESFQTRLRNLFEHYATGILEKKEYIEIKEDYTKEQENAKKALEETQKRAEELLDVQRSRIYWAEELIKYQNFDTVTKDLVDRFIDKVIVESSKEITVVFWFGDTFEELSGIKGELSYAV